MSFNLIGKHDIDGVGCAVPSEPLGELVAAPKRRVYSVSRSSLPLKAIFGLLINIVAVGLLSGQTNARTGASVPTTVLPSGCLNERVLAAIEKMPTGGGYAVTSTASKALGSAISLDKRGSIGIDAASATPSFCSGAVYLVLLNALKPNIDSISDPHVRKALVQALDVVGQLDGNGIWGRWNSNGPCMAITFAQSGMGRSFWGYKSAVAGDFLKLWWTEAIGRDEAGHSVIFLGFKKAENGEDGIEIWSSNKPLGYGKKVVAVSKIKHALVSRCENPERVQTLLRLKPKDSFLAGMLKYNTTPADIEKQMMSDERAAANMPLADH